MTLLQINATYGVGSTGRIVKDIHEQALKQGIRSYVACKTDVDDDRIYKIGNVFDYKMHAILCRISGRQAYFSKNSTRKLIRYIGTIKPDIIHLHNLHSNYIHLNMLLEYIAKKNISLILTLHDCWFFTGKCFHYTADKCFKWKHGCGSCPKKIQDTPAYVLDKTQNVIRDKENYFNNIKNLYVVGASQWIMDAAKESILSGAKLFYCYNGVDTTVFRPQTTDLRKIYGIKESDFVILGMANKWLLPRNREAFDAVCQNLDCSIKLVMIGVENNRDLCENIIGIPTIRQAVELAKWYAEADVFVNLTWEDTLPSVNMEALACGTPVITHNTCGAPETISETAGVIVEPGNIKELLCAIQTVRNNGKSNYELTCVEYAKTMFNVEKSYDKYFQIYEEMYKGLSDLH